MVLVRSLLVQSLPVVAAGVGEGVVWTIFPGPPLSMAKQVG
jgi:hypothetical protein